MSNNAIRRSNPHMRLLAFIAGWTLLAAPCCLAQISTPPTSALSPVENARLATPITFEVATVRISAPLSPQQVVSANAVGGLGAHLDGMRAQYTYMTLKALVIYAFQLRPYQFSGPDWMSKDHFDIVARLPEGSTKKDAPEMLRALLSDRFKLETHMETGERPVYALVVAKSGAKLQDSPARPEIDEDAELKPSEIKLDLPDGPARMSRAIDAPKNLQGATRLDMGTRGVFVYGIEEQSRTVHLEGSGVTMGGFADMLTQVMQMGGSDSRPVVDQTGLTGHYKVVLDLSLADLMAAVGGVKSGPSPPPDGGVTQASEPGGGGSSIFSSVGKLGLKLEAGKAPVQQLVVDRAEKNPSEN